MVHGAVALGLAETLGKEKLVSLQCVRSNDLFRDSPTEPDSNHSNNYQQKKQKQPPPTLYRGFIPDTHKQSHDIQITATSEVIAIKQRTFRPVYRPLTPNFLADINTQTKPV